MPSAIDEARMIPTSENDVINPGTFYFACLNLQRKTDPDSYWIVMRAPREWLPDGFFDVRPVQSRVFPFWIVGKDQRFWLPRSSLFYLNRSQREIFTDRAKRLEFINLFMLIDSFQNRDAALTHFKRKILDSTQQYNERRDRVDRTMARGCRRSLSQLMEGFSTESVEVNTSSATMAEPGADLTRPHASLCERGQTKKPRLRDSTTSNNSKPKHGDAVQTEIKSEREERYFALTQTIMDNASVSIYVGRHNRIYSASTSVLEQKSPVLYGLIHTNDKAQGQFIMHPKLYETDTEDFVTLLEFMQTGEYKPRLVPNPDNNENGPMGLDDYDTVEEYSQALVQAGRLAVLAKIFEVKGMTDLIIRKVTKAQFKTPTNMALIEFARVLFSERYYNQQPTIGTNDVLEAWVIERLGENFMNIMASEVESQKYLALVELTAQRHLHADVLEKAAAVYREIGGVPIVISDDDEE